jgi:small-conductance mechanosensitive channel
MKRFFKPPKEIGLEHMFETRSEAWAATGLEVHVNQEVVSRAQRRLTLLTMLLVAVILGDIKMQDHFDLVRRAHQHPSLHLQPSNWHVPQGWLTAAAVLLVLVLGWMISRDLSRVAPALFRRMDPATAGTVEFLIRFVAVAATALGALGVAGISLQAIAVGGAFTAVVLGLAAQQTLGNVFAGMVLLSARPFRLGERVRLQAGAVGGTAEGIVSSLGLLYTTLARGDDRIMIPNNVVLSAAVVPLREPEAVDVKVRLRADVRPSHVQAILDDNISTPTLRTPNVALEEIDGSELVVRVQATPERRSEGAQLADEIIAALATVTGEHQLEEQRRA